MDEKAFKSRTKKLAVAIIKEVNKLPRSLAVDVIGKQDETEYWLEILVEAGPVPQNQVASIYKETDEILAMTVASLKTLRARQSSSHHKS
ncbi:MAG TPA: four helix bundle protein [Anaerolineales bacterium]|nr:four helix bundle protein [Anaerolineales bacterium]